MTDPEFREQYKRLVEVHPKIYSSKEKMDTIWQYVESLDVDWLRRIVDHVVMTTNPYDEKYDIGYAATAERRARRSAQFAEEVAQASTNWNGFTQGKLEGTLEKYKAGSLWDAVDKSRKGQVG